MNEKICRLCLQTITENYQPIGQSLKNTLLNMNTSHADVKCIECTNNLEVFLKFKSTFDYMKETRLTDFKDDIDVDKKNIDITNNLQSSTESNRELRCCFCTKMSEREILTSINESKEHKFLMDVLMEHIPKLNLNITEDILTCETCLDGLQCVVRFLMKCLDVEQKINKYTEIKGANDKGQIELKDVQQFIFEPITKPEIDSEDVRDIKEVYDIAEVKYEKEIENPEVYIKTEDTDIKSEQDDHDSVQEPSINSTTIKIDGSLDILKIPPQKKHKKNVSQQEFSYKNSAGITMYKCEICSYESKHKKYLKCHQLTHKSTSDVTMLKCEMCPFETKRKVDLKRHILVHKSPSEIIMFKCELCPCKTKRKDYLKRHKLIHKSASEVTIFKCELCSYKTKHRDYLNKHKLTHKSIAESKMYKCDLCTYEARRKDYLKRHKLIHNITSEVTM